MVQVKLIPREEKTVLKPDTPTNHKLPLLEEALAIEIARYYSHGLSEEEWRSFSQRLAKLPPSANVANTGAGNRLEQAVLNLKTAHLWPW
jgi:hypothetical protein